MNDPRQAQILEEFSRLTTWEERYGHIIDLGRALPKMADADKIEDIKVRGCQSQVWLKADFKTDRSIHFTADSDALIVKGLIAMLLRVYSDRAPKEILTIEPHFVAELGLAQHLSPSRANGLNAMIKQIKYYALAFQATQ